MSIKVNLDVIMAKRKMTLTELSEKVGITMANLSILKTGKAKAIRFSTLESICQNLDCQPGDILVYDPEDPLVLRQRGPSIEKAKSRNVRNSSRADQNPGLMEGIEHGTNL